MQFNDDKPYDDINVTPMVDLFMVLLLIFIILTTTAVQALKVNLPTAKSSPSTSKAKTKGVTVNNSGEIFLDTVPVTVEVLRAQLAQAKAQSSGLQVVVRGDTQTPYQKVFAVLDVLQQLGIQPNLAFAPPGK